MPSWIVLMSRIKFEPALFWVQWRDMVVKTGSHGIQCVQCKPFHLSRNTAISLILLALLVAGIVAYTESGIGQPKATPVNSPAANIEPVAPQYLPYEGGESRIFLVSANSTYGSYPGPSVPQMGNAQGVRKGDPCFIINVTVRNDYSAENPLPDQSLYNMSNPDANVNLTALIFNSRGQIKATDVTPPYPAVPLMGTYLSLASGENGTATIYLATSHQDINRSDVVLQYVGTQPAP